MGEGQWEELVEQEWVVGWRGPKLGALVIENVATTLPPQRKDHQESSTFGQEAPKHQEQVVVYQVVVPVQQLPQAQVAVPVVAGDMKDMEATVEP